MENNYPSFDSLDVKYEYSKRIKNMFKERNLNWTASPSIIHPQIFVRPNDSFQWHKFRNVSRMSVHTIDGVMRFGVRGNSSPGKTSYKEILEKKGYFFQQNPDSKGWWLIKPLDKLEYLVDEIRDIEPDLLKR
jgi:hypothetical protein